MLRCKLKGCGARVPTTAYTPLHYPTGCGGGTAVAAELNKKLTVKEFVRALGCYSNRAAPDQVPYLADVGRKPAARVFAFARRACATAEAQASDEFRVQEGQVEVDSSRVLAKRKAGGGQR